MDDRLPSWLENRCRWLSVTESPVPRTVDSGPGEFVLYWMHNAVRDHENPALDVAVCLARQNGLPLLIYHGLSENYPFASDRHHAFILQAAREVQRSFERSGIRYAFHLERRGHRGPHLRDLARRAAVLVTEEMPVQPLIGWMERLRCLTTTPIACVDTSCILTPRLAPSTPEKAYAYRRATRTMYESLVDQPYPTLPPDMIEVAADLRYDGPLGFEPIDLQDVCLAKLLRHCKIDHSIAPVCDTPGGSRAGYERFNGFFQNGLSQYSKNRHNASDATGVSRISAYLHYGMVSPFRVVRQLASIRTSDAKKFLDMLLVWRERAFHHCWKHQEELNDAAALPVWSRQSMRKHSGDPREHIHDWETLARGKTSQPLWNLAQRSLVRHGELHPNLRMTWGKAFLPMTATPEQALRYCVDLNHRYALDGRSPSSYGGILWCFGQFDRPSQNESPIFGVVRARSVDAHARVLDHSTLEKRVSRPIARFVPKIAIIGAGLGGLFAAQTLSDHGLDVTVFEKSWAPGGRCATRQVRQASNPLEYDHGAQYFTVRDDRFARHVCSWIDRGLVAAWAGRVVEASGCGKVLSEKKETSRYVSVPNNRSLADTVAAGMNVLFSKRIKSMHRSEDRWTLLDDSDQSFGPFDSVILNVPPPQAIDLLPTPIDEDLKPLTSVRMDPCWTVMVRVRGLTSLNYEGAFVNSGPISWFARNDRKPGRWTSSDGSLSQWVLHASPSWSTDHLDATKPAVIEELLAAFEKIIGQPIPSESIEHVDSHRWLYAKANNPLDVEYLWSSDQSIGLCGDWCCGSRVEGAFLSGTSLAGQILREITIDRAAASFG